MRSELQQRLFDEFPNLFRDRENNQFPIRFGIEHGDGWFLALHTLCERIEGMILELPEADRRDYVVDQVKEKFGGLRFYMRCSTDAMMEAIREAEERCWRTCEVCGASGMPRSLGGWVKTVCERCADDIGKARAELEGKQDGR